jgi:dTDP-glucose pyrophosphorylase
MNMKEKRISAFILAAGRGTRMGPFSHDIPKPMLPLLNNPIIFHSLNRLLKAGFKDFGIIIHKDDSIIPSYAKRRFPYLNPQFIIQKKALGTGHAVLQIEQSLNTENFLVIAGDSLFSANFLKQLVTKHLKDDNAVTLSLEEMEFDLMRYSSSVDFRDDKVYEVREKPQSTEEILSNLNSAALYVFSRSIFEVLKKMKKSQRDEYELATAINYTIRQGRRVGGLITERICHISTPYDLWRFNLQFLHETSQEKIYGNIIGKNVILDKSAIIQESVIGDNSVISSPVSLKRCVVLPNTVIHQDFENSLVKSNFFEQFSLKTG